MSLALVRAWACRVSGPSRLVESPDRPRSSVVRGFEFVWAQIDRCLVTSDLETGYLTSGKDGRSTKGTPPNGFGQQAPLNSTHGGQFSGRARGQCAAQRRLAFG